MGRKLRGSGSGRVVRAGSWQFEPNNWMEAKNMFGARDVGHGQGVVQMH